MPLAKIAPLLLLQVAATVNAVTLGTAPTVILAVVDVKHPNASLI